jgi:hypothetical protein
MAALPTSQQQIIVHDYRRNGSESPFRNVEWFLKQRSLNKSFNFVQIAKIGSMIEQRDRHVNSGCSRPHNTTQGSKVGEISTRHHKSGSFKKI